jgi:hypothetical protein
MKEFSWDSLKGRVDLKRSLFRIHVIFVKNALKISVE